jgi:hypothetical protein
MDQRSAGYLTVTYHLRAASAVAVTPTAPSLSDRLRQLDDAHRSGLLTDAEYRTKRAAILAEH